MRKKRQSKPIVIKFNDVPDVSNGGRPPRSLEDYLIDNGIDPDTGLTFTELNKIWDQVKEATWSYKTPIGDTSFMIFGTGSNLSKPLVKWHDDYFNSKEDWKKESIEDILMDQKELEDKLWESYRSKINKAIQEGDNKPK